MTRLHPAAAGLDYFAEIAKHSAGLAEAAESNLTARVEHCPGWTVADLVAHVWQVHWFWGTIVEQRLVEQRFVERSEIDRPATPAEDVLIGQFRAGALRMIEILRAADQEDQVWTWAPSQQNVGFVSRHQVQEAAVHRWDAEHAAGREFAFEVAVSVDSIEEFLTFSVCSVSDPSGQARPNLAGRFVLLATDADAAWTIFDGELTGTVQFERGAGAELAAIRATASELLLWLYRRLELPVVPAVGRDQASTQQLIERFRALTFTD